MKFLIESRLRLLLFRLRDARIKSFTLAQNMRNFPKEVRLMLRAFKRHREVIITYMKLLRDSNELFNRIATLALAFSI